MVLLIEKPHVCEAIQSHRKILVFITIAYCRAKTSRFITVFCRCIHEVMLGKAITSHSISKSLTRGKTEKN